MTPQAQGCGFVQNASPQARQCPSQHSVDQRDPADSATDQEAQRDGDEHRDQEGENPKDCLLYPGNLAFWRSHLNGEPYPDNDSA